MLVTNHTKQSYKQNKATQMVNCCACSSEEDLLEVSAVEKPPVGGNFCLQLHLDVQQSLVLLRLVLDVVAQFCDLRLQLHDDGVETLDLHVVTHFRIPQGGLQGSFLENEAKRTQELGLSWFRFD